MRTAIVLVLALAVAGCTGFRTKQKIAAACDTASSALAALTAARKADRISKADLDRAIAVHESTNAYCQPIAESLSPADYAALAAAAARLTQMQGAQ